MEKKMEVTENTFSWMKITAAEEMIGIYEQFAAVDADVMRTDQSLYEIFMMANVVLDEVEEIEQREVFSGWDACVDAREWYKNEVSRKKEGE